MLNPVSKTQEGVVLKARAHGRLAKYETWRLGKRSLKAEEPARLQRAGYFALELGTEVVHLHGLHVYHTWRGATACAWVAWEPPAFDCGTHLGVSCIRMRHHLRVFAVRSTCVTWTTPRTTSINLR